MDIVSQKALDFFTKQQKDAAGYMEKRDQDKKDKKEKGETFANWLSWNGMSYIYLEDWLDKWTHLLSCLQKFLEDNPSGTKVYEYISGIREQYVQRVLSYRPAHSTNPLSNMIDDERNEVDKGIAGSGSMNSDSLNYLLISLRRIMDDEKKSSLK